VERLRAIAGCAVRLGYPARTPEWRNGRRSGLKLRGPQGRPSSNLGSGTKIGSVRVVSGEECQALVCTTQAGVDAFEAELHVNEVCASVIRGSLLEGPQ
jgi:hypothetical protein